MNKGSTERLISWAFAFLAVIAVWQINPPVAFDKFALAIGAKKDSIVYTIIQNAGVPLFLTVAAWLSVQIYQKIIWPKLPSSNFKGGWWIYALMAKTDAGPLPVVGYFRVVHGQSTVNIPEGRSFYVDGGVLLHRGDWQAETVWHDTSKLRFVFNMHAVINPREPIPSQYDGFFDVAKTSDKPLLGRSAWCGYFHDLGDRRSVLGPVIAEYLKRKTMVSGDVQELLKTRNAQLVSRAKTMLSCHVT